MRQTPSAYKSLVWVLGLIFALAGCKALGIKTGQDSFTPASINSAHVGASMAVPSMVTAFRVEDDGKQNRVVFEANRPPAYMAKMEHHPPRLSIDLTAAVVQETLGVFKVGKGIVDKVEVQPISNEENQVRVTIDLMKPSTYKVVEEGQELVVVLDRIENVEAARVDEEDLGPGKKKGVARIKAVDFTPIGESGRTRLTIKTDRELQPQVFSRDNGRIILVSMTPAAISKDLIRPLNTEYFQSAVNFIEPKQVEKGSVDFFIRLREAVPYQLSQKGLVTYLDFDSSAIPGLTANTVPTLKKVDAKEAVQPGPPVMAIDPSQPALDAGVTDMAAKPSDGEAESISGRVGLFIGQKKKFTGEKISLDFQNADVPNLLRLIGELTGKNVIVSPRVEGIRVTLKLKDVPWDQALDMIASTNGLVVIDKGNIIRIDTLEQIVKEKEEMLKEQQAEASRQQNVPKVKRIFSPQYNSPTVIAREMENMLPIKDIKKEKQQREVEGETGQKEIAEFTSETVIRDGIVSVVGDDIFVEADMDRMPEMERIFQRMDVPSKRATRYIYEPKHKWPTTLRADLEKLSDIKASYSIVGNDLYIDTNLEYLARVKNMLERLDKPAKQVLIEARIVEAQSSFSRDLGVNWNVDAARTGSESLQDDWTVGGAVNLLTAPTSGGALSFGLLSEVFDVDAQLYASQEDGEVNIVSAPRIIAQNGEEVLIEQGTSIPYETVSDNGTNIEFKDAVLSLKVTPSIMTNEEIVILDIVSKKETARYDINATQPPIDKNITETRLFVRNGQTVVIGGIVIDEESKSANRVPTMHKIPILGWLFKSDSVSSSKQETLIFITAHVISTDLEDIPEAPSFREYK